MEKLPNDPMMLFSSVNMLLRDEEYKNLDELCYAFGIERKALEAKLATSGFEFNEKENKFW